MCRISGIIAPSIPSALLQRKAEAMCDAQKHGGPDSSGIFAEANLGLAFGHRRLAIIDLSANGNQPMYHSKADACITFNGEIYNYKELRSELKNLGADFLTETDTEVILQAYSYWGTASFSRLKGIFAFGIFDKGKKLTYLVRDSQGVKPLYYSATANSLIFASEVRAFKSADLSIEEDSNWRVRFLAFGNIPEPFTTLKHVYSLKKSHYLCWDHQSSTYSIFGYKTYTTTNNISTKAQAEEAVKDGFTQAIKKQLLSDAPIGVFLSGGIDSSLITLLADRQKHGLLNTVSIHFDERSYDESQYQSIVRDHIQGQKFSHLIKQTDFDKNFQSISQAMDMPTTDGINTWFISKYAHNDGLKAVLSGIGGDELFGGYPSFNRIKHINYLRKLPTTILELLAKLNDRYKRVTYLKYDHYLADYLFLRGIFTVEEIAGLLEIEAAEVADVLFKDTPNNDLGPYDALQASWLETNVYMQNQLLRDTDVMGMNNALEIRVPFLDEDFCSLIDDIPTDIRFSSQPKQLLIAAFSGLLPQAVWNRPKMGFTFPLQQWLKKSPVTDKNAYKNKYALKTVQQFLGDQIHWSKAFALYQVQNDA